MKQRKQNQISYATYIWVFAIGLTILYAFSLVPRPTGFAAGDTPSECEGYASADDDYCDDLQENCADKYVKGTSLEACKECTTGQWKQSKWCKGAGNAWPDTGPDSALCKEFFDDVTCDDSPKDCGNDYKSDNSIDHCNECQTGGFKCSIVKESKPNLYIASFSGFQPKTGTGLYGYNHDLPSIFRPLRLYEVNSDNSIVKGNNGKKKSIDRITFSFIISNNGNPTYEEFSIELQRLKKDSSGWQALQTKHLVLLEPSATVEWRPLNEFIAYNNPKLRIVVDSDNKIDESNENDNQYLFDIPMSKTK